MNNENIISRELDKIYKDMWEWAKESRRLDKEYIINLEWQIDNLVKEIDILRKKLDK